MKISSKIIKTILARAVRRKTGKIWIFFPHELHFSDLLIQKHFITSNQCPHGSPITSSRCAFMAQGFYLGFKASRSKADWLGRDSFSLLSLLSLALTDLGGNQGLADSQGLARAC